MLVSLFSKYQILVHVVSYFGMLPQKVYWYADNSSALLFSIVKTKYRYERLLDFQLFGLTFKN